MEFIKKNLHALLLTGLCLIVISSHFLYVLSTGQYPTWDEVHYIGYALKFHEILSNPTVNVVSEIYEILNERQPLYSLISTIPLLFFGTYYAYSILLFINGLFFVSTIVGIYFLSKEFFSKGISLLSAFIFACYGFPLFYLHYTYTETSATAFIVVSIFYLLKTKNFQDRKNVLIFSILFAASVLTRWTSPVFILGPFFIVLLKTVWPVIRKKKIGKETLKAGKNFLIFLAVGLLAPILLYFIPIWSDFMKYLISGSSNAEEWVKTLDYLPPGLENPFSTRSMMFYFNIISQQTIFFFALFAIGMMTGIIFFRKYAFLILGFFVPYFYFTFVTVYKDDRFIVPLYPIIAIISIICLKHIFFNRKILRWLIVISILIFGSLNFLAASWAVGPMGQRGLQDVILPEFIHHPRRIYLTPMVWPPRPRANGEELIAYLAQLEENQLSNIESPIFLHFFVLDQANGEMGKKAVYENTKWTHLYTSSQRVTTEGIENGNYEKLLEQLDKAHVLIVKDKMPIQKDKEVENKDLILNFYKAIDEGYLPKEFVEVKRINVPLDNTNFVVYLKKGKISQESKELLTDFLVKQK